MTSTTSAVEPGAVEAPKAPGAETATTERRTRSIPRAGWTVIAAKEFGDHILSSRFLVLAIIMAIAAAVPLYFISGQIRDAPSGATGFPALFIALFWLTPSVNDQIQLPSVVGFLALVGPLLGLTFSFDAINGERANGTLPRLLSQPIHRDDVINGKFTAGLAVIALVVVVMILAVTTFALIRLGVVPEAVELLRIVLWVLVTMVYIALWLAFGLLLSVAIRRAATSALVGFGTWLLLSFFGGLIVSLINGIVAPLTAASAEDALKNIGLREMLQRLLPDTLYREASLTLLNPQVTTISTPATLGQYAQAQQRIPSLFSLDQSFILIWPQVVGLVGLTVACFALAYVLFMRQEVRA
ncbi:MAG TPA: ABC transporter permease [Candidatus Limnocylindrales bacterium]|nr:ABC transporter permease [Candidatus Limnocylindrales bacterium]